MADHAFSEDGTRAVKAELFGIACYEGAEVDGTWTGRHIGVVRDESDAAAFLRGETPPSLIRIYNADGRLDGE